MNPRRIICVAFSAIALAAGCKTTSEDVKTVDNRSLYDRLGGKDSITAVVDDFVTRVAADERINRFFAQANVPRLKKNLADQICQATGGPCNYTGKDMKSAHQGMGISEPDFDALVQDLVASLDTFKVGEREKGELLAALGPIKKEIVER